MPEAVPWFVFGSVLLGFLEKYLFWMRGTYDVGADGAVEVTATALYHLASLLVAEERGTHNPMTIPSETLRL